MATIATATTGPTATPTEAQPKVLFVTHVARLSGAEIALERLIGALAERVEATVALFEEGPLRERLEHVGAAVAVIPMSGSAVNLRRRSPVAGRAAARALPAGVAQVRRLRRLVEQVGPDIVHANSLKAGLCASATCRWTGVPLIWHVHDRITTEDMGAGQARIVRAALRLGPSMVIANSASTRGTFARGTRSAVVANALDRRFAARRSRDPSTPVRRVGMIGRFAPWKGQELFLRAFARAFPETGVEAVLVGSALFGEEEYERHVRRAIEALGLEGRVVIRGFRPDVLAELEDLDVLVHASLTPEPFGQVVLEGMAAGVPVVAAADGGPAELVTHGVDGLLYKRGSEEALAVELRRLASDPALRTRLVACGRERAQAFTPEAVAADVLRIYEAVLAR